jgi:glycogen operon protein
MPMILMGDEVRRTQKGNNNAYCQDNEISWFDWSLVDKHADVLRFARLLIAQRARRTVEHEQDRISLLELLAQANEAWHGVKLNQPDWGDASLSVALGGELKAMGQFFHLMLNAYWEPLEFELPQREGGISWRRWIDTGLDSPDDIVFSWNAPAVSGFTYRVQPRSVAMLVVAGSTRASMLPK